MTQIDHMFNSASSLLTLNANNWDISSVGASGNVFAATNGSLVVYCDQGGSPGTGLLFGKSCSSQ